ATTPKQGGSATFAMINEISSLDPAKIINAASQGGPIGNGLYDVLIWVDTQTGKVNPGLALSLTSQDGANWTMKLRPNVKFTAGPSLDAAAVRFSWDRLKDPALGSPSRGAASTFQTVTVVDPLTLQITLTKVNYALPQLFGWYGLNWVVSPTAVQAL